MPGFCKSATLDEIAAHGYVLTPGRYVGAEDAEDDGEPFEEKMGASSATRRAIRRIRDARSGDPGEPGPVRARRA